MAYGDGLYSVIVKGNGDIHEISGYQEGRKLGVDVKQEEKFIQEIQMLTQEIQARDETLEAWRTVLIDNGLLTVPKTAEEIADEVAKEQIRILQEQEQRQLEREERQAEKDAQQLKINEAFLESIQKSNQTISQLEKTVKDLMKREHNEYSKRVIIEPNDNTGIDGASPKAPRNSRQSSGKKPTTGTVSTSTGK